MQDKDYLKWCAGNDKGIRPIAPSENLVRAYLEKSKTAIKSMELNAGAGITEWAVSAGYYARYFAVYALMSKIGVKCEIHDCTIALFAHLFGDSVPHHLIKELRQSKDDRVDLQYYPKEAKVNTGELIGQTKAFVLQIEEIIDGLDTEKIAALQNKAKGAVSR